MIYVMSGSGKAFAVIGVNYPVGSVCTCTDGTKTLNLKDTSGQGFFLIPYAATWTVTVTDGEREKSESVEITSEGQIESVALSYATYIFKSGQGLTAGYSVETGTSLRGNVSNSAINWSGNSESGGISIYIKPAVTLNDYTKLCVDFECSYNYGGIYGMGFGVGKNATSGSSIDLTEWTTKVTSTAQGAIARNIVQSDISALTGLYYIKIVGTYSAGKIYNIWLE